MPRRPSTRPSLRARRTDRHRGLIYWGPRVVLASLILLPIGYRWLEVVSGYTTPTTGCRVTGVIDGDTVRLDCPDLAETRGRLLGFDTPEVVSPQCPAEWRKGMAATAYLRGQIWEAGEIEARPRGTDRYGRLLITLKLDGEDVAERMLASGHARVYHGGKREGWCE